MFAFFKALPSNVCFIIDHWLSFYPVFLYFINIFIKPNNGINHSTMNPLPLSLIQQRFCLLSQKKSSAFLFNIYKECQFKGQLKLTILKQTLQFLIQRQTALQLQISVSNTEMSQTINKDCQLDLDYQDWRADDPKKQTQKLQELIDKQSNQSIDFNHSPLYRWVLIQTHDETHHLFIFAHRISLDGWSLMLAIKDLADIYTAFKTGKTPELPPIIIELPQFIQ